MTETWVRVSKNGRVVIPASFRRALGINAGDQVVLRIEDDELRITTLKSQVERAQRLICKHVKPGTSLVNELIAEREPSAQEWQRRTKRTGTPAEFVAASPVQGSRLRDRVAHPEREILRIIGTESKKKGTSKLSGKRIDQIIKTARRSRSR